MRAMWRYGGNGFYPRVCLCITVRYPEVVLSMLRSRLELLNHFR